MTHPRTRLMALAVVALVALAGCGGGSGTAAGQSGSAPPGTESAAAVWVAEPADGATVSSPVHVRMEATGLQLEPAGEDREGAGHFHVVVDTPCVEPGQPIPNDATHLHYGQAQTEADIQLTPGEHTLCLQAGDGAHTALDATHEITVTVR